MATQPGNPVDQPGSLIREVSVRLRVARLGPDGPPLLRRGHEPDLSASDRILLGELPGRPLVERPGSLLPYRAQNRYSREVVPRDFRAIELVNEHLSATFLPELGGRLWSLVDRTSGRDLLYQPDAIRFGNLALRDAWFPGGIEWNLGTTGHWGLTCSPVGAGVVETPAGPILRMWALERLTGLVWRVEAWLPAGARHLFTSARIVNHHDHQVAFYWWTNAAVPLTKGSRVLVPAAHSFHNDYSGALVRIDYPVSHGVDGSRPAQAPRSADYFFDISHPEGELAPFPWVAGSDGDGGGILLASTAELPGKKEFVWGNTRGGNRWQSWLGGDGRYYELQSGYTRTQKEHAALAGGDVATWVEAFGPVDSSGAGGYEDEVARVALQVPEDRMQDARAVFDAAAHTPPLVLHEADGWGRVEVEAGHLAADPAVPFRADLIPEQQAWVEAARTGVLSPTLAGSPMVGDGWRERLATTEPGWLRELLLGYCAWAAGDEEEAQAHWRASVAAAENAPALHCLATLSDSVWDAYNLAERAHLADPADDDLLVDYLVRARHVPGVVLRVVERLSPSRADLPRIRMEQARALVAEGRLATARAVIDELELPNLRETSDELEELWGSYTRATGYDEPLPAHLDFTMR